MVCHVVVEEEGSMGQRESLWWFDIGVTWQTPFVAGKEVCLSS